MGYRDLEMHLIQDGRVSVDAGGPFGLVPRKLYEGHFSPDEDNRVPMVLNCLLLRSEGKNILVDTGLGEKLTPEAVAQWGLVSPEGGLMEKLARLGVGPEDIDLVINTHLHSDHCGGNTRGFSDHPVAAFPRAEYWVQRIEWAEATFPNARTINTYHKENFQPLERQGKLRLLHGDTAVTRHVRCVAAPGHTRGHQCVLLQSGDWYGLFLGDLASYSIHMARTPWAAAYDAEPMLTISRKERWQKWALEHEAWLFFQHDPFMPVGRLIAQDGRLTIRPVEEAETLIESFPIRQHTD